ncbi:MAG: glycosyltransferase family 4 protein [Gammaproteobacteria bacterium]|nr:glycosyltransferase family 4 protein [Gammaproteobacteria bacterium]
MRFAFVVSMWFPFGGMQRTLLRIAEACVARGHAVDVYTGEWRGERPAGVGVVELATRAVSNHASNDRLAAAFAAAVNGRGYDCLVGFTKIPGLDVYYAADPCYAARALLHKPFYYRWGSRYRAFVRQERAVFGRGLDTDLMLIAHQEQAKFMRHYATEAARFHLLPPGINRARLQVDDPAVQRAALRAEFGIDAQAPVLLCIGSGFRTKGVDRAIEAMASLPDGLRRACRLLVVGDGKRRALQALVKRRGIAEHVVFCGVREDVAAFYRAADALVHAARSENTGTVLIEAMLCGLPVLATGNCGFAFHVRDADAGLVLAEPFSQPALNAALASLLTSARRPDWAANGPAYCDRVDLYSLIERAADVIIARGERNRGRHAARA